MIAEPSRSVRLANMRSLSRIWIVFIVLAWLPVLLLAQATNNTDELLPPEQAYALTVMAPDPDTVIAEWNIAEGYYMYRERFGFESLTPGVRLGEPQLPTGKIKEDEFFGKMEVYRNSIRAEIPVRYDDGVIEPLKLKVNSQGCADIGVCYPPQTQILTLDGALPVTPQSSAILTKANPTAQNDLLSALTQPTNPSSSESSAQNPVPTKATSATDGQLAVLSQPGNQTSSNNVLAQPGAPSPSQSVATSTGFISEQDRISRLLVEQRFWALPLFFGFGLLLAFTPCVFPMIPILSGIIAGQGASLTQRRAFLLSLVYVLAMALTYTAAGVGAALLGQNVQIWFQNPWVLITFSTLFVLMALAMFGFYDLQLPTSWQTRLSELSNRQRGGQYTGVAVMGFLSALIVGPCVAAPLIGVLAVISATGDVALGGTALFFISLGMGAPLLVIGTSAGKLLPKAGPWMGIIKAVFGVLMLAVAIWMLERILPETLSLLLWAILLITTATFMGALRSVSADKPAPQLLAKGLGTVLMAYGILLLVGVAAGGKDPLQPLRGTSLMAGSSFQQPLVFKHIKTTTDLTREIAQANGRPVMLDFYADWCVSCKEMERYTFTDPKVQTALRGTVLLQADVTANDEADQALLKQFNLIGPPAILFFDSEGTEQPDFRVVGFMSASVFSDHLALAIDTHSSNQTNYVRR